jgi:hypothetical protein
VFYVDPASGSDAGHTGASTCPFKTITKALEFLGGGAAAGTTIQLLDSDPASNGETFPIAVPTNVTIETATSVATPVTVTVSAGKVGFALAAAKSGLSNLVIDGAANTATTGIAVTGGSASATTIVQNVTVQNFAATGILVGTANKSNTAGAVTLGPNLIVTGNGTSTKPAPGLTISSGMAIVTGTASAGHNGHTSISGNTQHGILVTGSGYVEINPSTSGMSVSGTGQAYVDLDNNNVAGLFIAQTPTAVTAADTNEVYGVEIVGTVAGNGIHVEGGSFLTVTGSYVVGNHLSGIDITTYGTGSNASSSIAGINLGTALAPGLNTLQGTGNSSVNPVAGVCLGIPAAASAVGAQTLNAAGNIWGGVDCHTTTGTVSHTTGCQAGSDTDIGGIGGNANKNSALVSTCTLQ